MQILIYIGAAIGGLGLALLVASDVMYYRRTGDESHLKRIWLSKEMLSMNEHILNRTGLVLVSGAVILLALVLLLSETKTI